MRHQSIRLDAGGEAGAEAGGEAGRGPLARLFALCHAEQAREYQPDKRSIRIHGHGTTIRLERAFWTVLDEMAADEGIATAALVTRIHDHCLWNNDKNLASCLRVVCLKYINLGA
jgi:predicted DNA-binding ribbon-helix-helix protein